MARKITNLLDAAESGDLQTVRSLIRSRASVNVTDDPFDTLREAVRKNFRHYGLDEKRIGNHPPTLGRTPLHYASWNGHEDVVNALLDAGAEVDKRDYYDFTPLHLAIRQKHNSVARRLIESYADVDATWLEGDTALHFAASNSDFECARMLIAEQANVTAINSAQMTPIDIIAMKGHSELLEFLVDSFPATRSFRAVCPAILVHAVSAMKEERTYADKSHETYSSKYVSLDENVIVHNLRRLLKAGANIDGTKDGSAAIHVATHRGLSNVVEYLLEAKAKATSASPKDKLNGTPLEIARNLGKTEIVKLFERQ